MELERNVEFIKSESFYKKNALFQIKILFQKNLKLQMRQFFTNVFQLLTPLLCQLLIWLVKYASMVIISEDVALLRNSTNIIFPNLSHLPMGSLKNATFSPIYAPICIKWYMYDFKEAHMENSTILKSIFKDPFKEYCPEIRENVPYFEKSKHGINKDIYDAILEMDKYKFQPGFDIEPNVGMPDGAITFLEENKQKIKAKFQINDLRTVEMHRNNGVTKLSFRYNKEIIKSLSNLGLNTTSDEPQPENEKNTNNMASKIQELNHKMRDKNFHGASWPTLVITDAIINLMDMLTRNFIHHLNPNIFTLGSTASLGSMLTEEIFITAALNVLCFAAFPIALGLHLPVFMYTTVLEKEEKIHSFMLMHGQYNFYYWLVNLVFNMMLFTLSVSIFYLLGTYLAEMPIFVKTGFIPMGTVLLGWGLNQVCLSVFVQNFVSTTRTATVGGYILSIFAQQTSFFINSLLYQIPLEVPDYLFILPQMSFTRLFYHMTISCSDQACIQNLSDFRYEAKKILVYFFLTPILYFSLGFYLNTRSVKHKESFLTKIKKLFSGDKKRSNINSFETSQSPTKIDFFNKNNYNESENNKNYDEESVLAEKMRVAQIAFEYRKNSMLNENSSNYYPLVVEDLAKTYHSDDGTKNFAQKGVSFCLKKGEVFGLLGENGAGKTTIQSILYGFHKPDNGNAYISGNCIKNELHKVYHKIGVCPQFNLLWPDQTVFEHLMFYQGLKGVDIDKQAEHGALKVIRQVNLFEHKDKMTKQLSGGMKRRLSLAIALVGDPDVIFLDEPTTGLDPLNRMQQWKILEKIKHEKAIVLTTHHMEEADLLSTRIGIIRKGSLLTIGSQVEMKRRHSERYQLIMSMKKYPNTNIDESDTKDSVLEFIGLNFKEIKVRKHTHIGQLKNLTIDLPNHLLAKFSNEFNNKKSELGVSTWGLAQSTLRDIFLDFTDAK